MKILFIFLKNVPCKLEQTDKLYIYAIIIILFYDLWVDFLLFWCEIIKKFYILEIGRNR